jgi:hypothetical protein
MFKDSNWWGCVVYMYYKMYYCFRYKCSRIHIYICYWLILRIRCVLEACKASNCKHETIKYATEDWLDGLGFELRPTMPLVLLILKYMKSLYIHPNLYI